MAHNKDLLKTISRSKTALKTGVVGLTLSLAGAACAETSLADASVGPPGQARSFTLHEVEVFDTTMASFFVIDKENPGGPRSPHERYQLCKCHKCSGKCTTGRCGCRGRCA